MREAGTGFSNGVTCGISLDQIRKGLSMNQQDALISTFSPKTDLLGFADLNALKREYPDLMDNLPHEFPYAVSIGRALSRGILDTVEGKPNPMYFHHYRQANNYLDRTAFEISSFIESAGYKALPVGASQVLSRKPMTAHICHRRIAWQAGHGNRGLNNLLVNPEFGSALRLASVLTDMPLECGHPTDEGCDGCGACIDVCPASAIGKTCEDFDLDACFNKLDEFRKIPFVGQHICGVCVSACRGRRS